MPWLPKGPCSTRGCKGRAVKFGKCADCYREREKQYDADRGSSSSRGYGDDWQRVRAQHLIDNPWCEEHGPPCRATEVDHEESVADNPARRLDRTNLRGYCKSAHSRRTARDQGFRRRRRT